MEDHPFSSGISSGAWVRGTTLNDERIRGYIRHYDALTSMYTVTVVVSDRKEIVGRMVFARASQLVELPLEGVRDPEALNDLIDLALLLRDETWFYELTAELLTLYAEEGRTVQTTPS
jgi:hypothetical protein